METANAFESTGKALEEKKGFQLIQLKPIVSRLGSTVLGIICRQT